MVRAPRRPQADLEKVAILRHPADALCPPGPPPSAWVETSWARSRRAGVGEELVRAPLVLDRSALEAAQRDADWIALADRTFAPMLSALGDSAHLLGVFDALGRMLDAKGDPWVLDAMQAIHFTPGASWAEEVVGTNGPGTALATGRPVHVVGDQHYCDAWRSWHCAATPVSDPLTGEILGALDVSGPSSKPDPYALELVLALRLALEQALQARSERRARLVLEAFSRLLARYPKDTVFAVDRHGRVLGASGSTDTSPRQLEILQRLGRDGETDPTKLPPELEGAVLQPVEEDGRRVGLCILHRARPAAKRRSTRYVLDDLAGQSPGIVAALDLARGAGRHELPVLVLGESGVGKEVLAQSIHAASARSYGPFVPVNCGAISPQLVESELFGYVGGAFSGARREGSAGKVVAANGGTLFLDEVTELPILAQTALLRLLQEGEVAPVGAAEPVQTDVRIIAATNRDPEAEVAAGRFRRDLYYRLAVLPIELPPLRDRPEDLELLTRRFIDRAERETGARVHLSEEALDALRAYAWPGNVRELENLIRRLAATVGAREVTVELLPAPIREAARNTLPKMAAATSDALRAQLVAVIEKAGTMAEAAAQLGMNRSTLYRQLERYGLRPKRTLGDR